MEIKYKLKDNVDFELVNEKSKMKFDFDLSDYYDKKTRLFTFPKGYVEWNLMADVFINFLEPLNLIEVINNE